ncbi:M23/M56 family metallopeptidase [Vallitalea pronyensis]|nr:M23/M56 family metallopeptidase [Vallitalea pronyensis]
MMYVTNAFTMILSMSIVSTFIGVIILLIRKVFVKRIPSMLLYVLWMVMMFRLISPFSIANPLNVFNLVITDVEHNVITMTYTEELSRIEFPRIETYGHGHITDTTRLVSSHGLVSKENMMMTASFLWALGVLIVFFYNVIQYIKMGKRIGTATILKPNPIHGLKGLVKVRKQIKVYTSDKIDTPFVLGLLHPRIYIPVAYTNHSLTYVLIHELVHIKRWDFRIKPLAYMICMLHWFNPIVWLAIHYMNQDIEMACDEKVIHLLGQEHRQEYAHSLIDCVVGKKMKIPCWQSSYNANNLTLRVKHIIGFREKKCYEKILLWMCIMCIGLTLSTNPLILKHTESIIPIDLFKVHWHKDNGDSKYIQAKQLVTTAKPIYENPVTRDTIMQDYYIKSDKAHHGIDILAHPGEPIKVVDDGYVTFIGHDEHCHVVKIDHGDGYESWYGGYETLSVLEHETVSKGEIIGVIGNTGTGPHLHLAIVYNGEFVDPKDYLPSVLNKSR